MTHWLATQVPGICMGLVLGAFMPGLGRRIKALFVKETRKI